MEYMEYTKLFSNPVDGIKHMESNLPILNMYKFECYGGNRSYSDESLRDSLEDWRMSKYPHDDYTFCLKQDICIFIKKINEIYEVKIQLSPQFENYEKLCSCLSEVGWTRQPTLIYP